MPLKPAIAATALAISSALAQADVNTQKVEYTIGDQTFVGYLTYDDAKSEPRPGVLVCHEWWGNNEYSSKRAHMLAEQGYVAFALDVYGKDKVTTDPKQAGAWAGEIFGDVNIVRERAAAGLKVLAENPRVDKTRLAAIGYCMGGSVALELARSGHKHTENLRVVAPFHAGNLLAKTPEDNKNIKGTVVVFHGADDTFVPEGDIQKFEKQMNDAHIDYLFVSFGHAVHAFTNPAADKANIPGVKYDKKADERSWKLLLDLLAKNTL